MIEHNLEELYKAQDEMLSEAERINAMFRPAIAEIMSTHAGDVLAMGSRLSTTCRGWLVRLGSGHD